MDKILEKIQDMDLSRVDVRIADYISEHLDTIGLQTSSSLAAMIGVSDTSLIRFVRKLGYRSYLDFRSEMNVRITKQYQEAQESRLTQAEEPSALIDCSENNLVRQVSSDILDNLKKAISWLDNQTVQEVVDLLINSEHKCVAGFHTTASCAKYMAARLGQLLPHVISLTNADASSVETILDINEKDCLMVYSFLRHAKINAPLMDIARSNGAKIILVTDRISSPLAKKADAVLLAPVDGSNIAYSLATPMCISEVLLMMIINQSGKDSEHRLHRLEELMKDTKLY